VHETDSGFRCRFGDETGALDVAVLKRLIANGGNDSGEVDDRVEIPEGVLQFRSDEGSGNWRYDIPSGRQGRDDVPADEAARACHADSQAHASAF
jgi:hypothetical protein